MNFNKLFTVLRKEYPTRLLQLKEFEDWLYDEEFTNFDDIKFDVGSKDSYIKQKMPAYCKDKICQITSCPDYYANNNNNSQSNNKYNNKSLTTSRLYLKSKSFDEGTDFKSTANGRFIKQRFVKNPDYRREHDLILKSTHLRLIETASMNSRSPIGEGLITMYHQSELPLNQYISKCDLFDQIICENHDGKLKNQDIYHSKYQKMKAYLDTFERLVYKSFTNIDYQEFEPINDDINHYIQYMTEINHALKDQRLMNRYPAQLDTFWVPPGYKIPNIDLDNLQFPRGSVVIKSTPKTRTDDGAYDVFRILRDASNKLLNIAHNQRVVMLIIRKNMHDTKKDIIYIFKPSIKNKLPSNGDFTSYSELPWFCNTKGSIIQSIPQLNSDKSILGLSHHLHGNNVAKIYLSYNGYGTRVFKKDILNKLPLLFTNDKCTINDNTKIDFGDEYKEYTDLQFKPFTKYYFGVKKYESYTPVWSASNARAMSNVYVPKSNPKCTADLNDYIDCPYPTPSKLYYKLDYTIAMQVMDNQHVYYKGPSINNGQGICIINTELRNKQNEKLYAIIIANPYKSKQKWKIIDYKHISDAFMTAKDIELKYGIFKKDLKPGSISKSNDFIEKIGRINVTKEIIQRTRWQKARIIQSQRQSDKVKSKYGNKNDKHKYKKNKSKKNNNNNNNANAFKLSQATLIKLAIESLYENGDKLIPIISFKFHKKKYYLEKLLPIRLPNIDKYIAISFKYNEQFGKTQASAICLDLCDMYNKAGLVQNITNNVDCNWLARTTHSDHSIDNLDVCDEDSPILLINNNDVDSKENIELQSLSLSPRSSLSSSLPSIPSIPLMNSFSFNSINNNNIQYTPQTIPSPSPQYYQLPQQHNTMNMNMNMKSQQQPALVQTQPTLVQTQFMGYQQQYTQPMNNIYLQQLNFNYQQQQMRIQQQMRMQQQMCNITPVNHIQQANVQYNNQVQYFNQLQQYQ